jgi:glycosyltransferase involved in cell wall biosynthesis
VHLRVVLECVYQRTPDGATWTVTPFWSAFYRRYLGTFSSVEVVARVEAVAAPAVGWRRVDGPDITVRAITPYRGLGGFLRHRRAVVRELREMFSGPGALILRLPSPLAGCIHADLMRSGRPYGVEVLGDPWDVFAPGVVRHPLRPLLRWRLSRQQRQQCHAAAAAAYVTEQALQRRYPSAGPSFACSDVDLGPESLAPAPRTPPAGGPIRLVMVGSLAQLYKAPDVLIRAIAGCRAQGLPLELDLIGDGSFRPRLERLAGELGIADQVRFLGHLPAGPAVRECLDRAHGFVLPSRTEGLPKAMVEAMARGLPCIGSRIGGIPELLDDGDLVPPGDVAALSALLRLRFSDAAWMARASARNLERAQAFSNGMLDRRREEFYRAVRDASSPAAVR